MINSDKRGYIHNNLITAHRKSKNGLLDKNPIKL